MVGAVRFPADTVSKYHPLGCIVKAEVGKTATPAVAS